MLRLLQFFPFDETRIPPTTVAIVAANWFQCLCLLGHVADETELELRLNWLGYFHRDIGKARCNL
jgi:hypothetical protein